MATRVQGQKTAQGFGRVARPDDFRPSSPVNPGRPVGSIRMESARIRGNLEQLGSAIEEIRGRLQPVLTNRPTDVVTGGEPGLPHIECECASEIRADADRIESLTAQVQDLIDRLDV